MSTVTLDSLHADITALRSEVKSLSKLIRKVRAAQEDPTGEKAKERAKNNGFNRPLCVSGKLREFLGLTEDEEIARSEVTRRINKYITENNLKHPDNGRVIILDDKLTNLLEPPDGVQVTFLNIQRYISPHYVKNTTGGETQAAAPPAEVTNSPKKEKVKRPVVRKKAAAPVST